MGPPVLLMCLMVWSCARLVQCEESAGQICGGLDGCSNISTLKVKRGHSKSVSLLLNASGVKLVKKCDLGTKKLKEEIITGFGEPKSFTNKATSISLVGGNFTVLNAGKAEEGFYRIEPLLNDTCLAGINVTVLDPPLPMAVTPSSDVSSSVTSKVTEPPEASPPGTYHTAVYVAVAVVVAVPVAVPVAVLVYIMIAKGVIQKLIKKKSKCRPNEATSEVDPEQLMNGSRPPQQEESTTV